MSYSSKGDSAEELTCIGTSFLRMSSIQNNISILLRGRLGASGTSLPEEPESGAWLTVSEYPLPKNEMKPLRQCKRKVSSRKGKKQMMSCGGVGGGNLLIRREQKGGAWRDSSFKHTRRLIFFPPRS